MEHVFQRSQVAIDRCVRDLSLLDAAGFLFPLDGILLDQPECDRSAQNVLAKERGPLVRELLHDLHVSRSLLRFHVVQKLDDEFRERDRLDAEIPQKLFLVLILDEVAELLIRNRALRCPKGLVSPPPFLFVVILHGVLLAAFDETGFMASLYFLPSILRSRPRERTGSARPCDVGSRRCG